MDAENSDTPRTNSAFSINSLIDPADFARQLERELEACETHNKIQHEGLAQAATKIESLYKELNELRRQNERLMEKLNDAKEIISHFGWTSSDSTEVILKAERWLASQSDKTPCA